jgi:nickel/cobalt transporter (NiCoT) family protein
MSDEASGTSAEGGYGVIRYWCSSPLGPFESSKPPSPRNDASHLSLLPSHLLVFVPAVGSKVRGLGYHPSELHQFAEVRLTPSLHLQAPLSSPEVVLRIALSSPLLPSLNHAIGTFDWDIWALVTEKSIGGPGRNRFHWLSGQVMASPMEGVRTRVPSHQTEDIKPPSNLKRFLHKAKKHHTRLPGIRRVPFPALGIISLLVVVNIAVWIIAGIVLHFHPTLVSTAVLSYTLGLRHALDADHISAIDLMTRRLVAAGQRPVTVGTFFSLGHSTIVVITSVVVAATAAAVSDRFDSFGTVGSIIGTSVSAAFLLLLGLVNAYILYKLFAQLRKVLRLSPNQAEQAWKVEGAGCLFLILKKMFKLIDRPWKMYPLGVLFGLGFDTSSEIALLGISSIQAAKGTSIWLILLFPVLFTAGMCLVDTIDGALMLTLYIMPMGAESEKQQQHPSNDNTPIAQVENSALAPAPAAAPNPNAAARAKDPLTFLYYSIVLTSLTVIVALVIGTIQLLSLILHVANPSGTFWDGIESAGEHYEIIGGAICASFVVFGGVSVLLYRPWRRWVERGRRLRIGIRLEGQGGEDEERGGVVCAVRSGGVVSESKSNAELA